MSKLCSVFLMLFIFVFAIFPYANFKNYTVADVTHIKKTEYQNNFEVTGIIESPNATPVKLSYPACIKKCYVENNSYVNKGQILFTLDTDKMEEYVKSSDFTQYIEAGISLNKSDLAGVSEEIYASESGYIRELYVNDGDIVFSDENICVIETDESSQLKITINQDDYSKVSVGDMVLFSTLVEPEKKYSAIVNDKTASVRRETYITGAKTVVDVYAEINDIDDSIVSGLEISGIIGNDAKIIYTLPFEYINQDEDGEYVLVYDKGDINKIYILTGIETEDSAEILTEFEENTLFVKNTINAKGKLLLKYDF